MKVKSAILFIILFFISSCGAPRVNTGEYVISDIDTKKTSAPLPEYIIQKKKPKVVVLPPSDTTQYSMCQLYANSQEYLTQALAQSGSVELIERSQLNAIMNELKFRAGVSSDIDIKKFAKIAEGVDFVFVGSVSKAYTRARFTPESSWTDKKGKTHYTPASCLEEAETGLVFRLLEFPAGIVQKSFNMNAVERNHRQVSSQYDCRVQDPCGLLNKAVEKAINKGKKELMNAFPVYGYIYKTMTNRKNPRERLAFINLGTSDGIKAGMVVEIIEFIRERDPVKNIDMIIPQTVGECTVTETDLLPDRSICIITENAVDRVFVGQAIKTK